MAKSQRLIKPHKKNPVVRKANRMIEKHIRHAAAAKSGNPQQIARQLGMLKSQRVVRRVQDLSQFEIEVFHEVAKELQRSYSMHPREFASAHEGHSVVREELEEVWDEIRAGNGESYQAGDEMVQVAANAIRYIVDLAIEVRTPSTSRVEAQIRVRKR